MAAPVLTAAAVIVCPHGGAVAVAAAASRVLIGGVPALTVGAVAAAQNCALPPGQACVTVTWPAGATRVFADGKPVLIQSVTGLCLSAAGQPTGAPLVAAVQSRVMAR